MVTRTTAITAAAAIAAITTAVAAITTAVAEVTTRTAATATTTEGATRAAARRARRRRRGRVLVDDAEHLDPLASLADFTSDGRAFGRILQPGILQRRNMQEHI